MARCFPAQVSARTRILLLGSLPGQASLAADEYYAHPRNHFWRLTGALCRRDLVALSYAERLAALDTAGIGLWDVVAQAERKGSLDADLRDVTRNDLDALIRTLPALRVIGFNGKTAFRAARTLEGRGLVLLDLPSSSPAHAIPFEAKLARWQALQPWIIPVE